MAWKDEALSEAIALTSGNAQHIKCVANVNRSDLVIVRGLFADSSNRGNEAIVEAIDLGRTFLCNRDDVFSMADSELLANTQPLAIPCRLFNVDFNDADTAQVIINLCSWMFSLFFCFIPACFDVKN